MSNTPAPIYWYVDPQAGSDPSGLEGLFSSSEACRFEAMKFELRRKSFIAGRRVAKHVLMDCVPELRGCSTAQMSIDNHESGAPYALVNDRELPGVLSISHSGDAAAAVYTSDSSIRIGIDLEAITPRAPSFLETYFTPSELKWVSSAKEKDRALVSTLIWSAKEAVLKALQTGLRVDTREIEILADDSPVIDGLRGFGISAPMGWHWQGHWRILDNFVITIAVGGPVLGCPVTLSWLGAPVPPAPVTTKSPSE
ncbi:4'-phosphopantetheinyl transferase family protein [Ornatilinea apprima]|uniref:4'-phosphopantetheinyl transferase family protein n=1 Tax=Ornatilinea apprima TaxID=1134406 RepID=UPI000946416A|nr:4'-phosphopantetheinyl transferase family protein [Ornatilinea apprima]